MDASWCTAFSSRQTWKRQVAYASQFADPDNRAHQGQAKIKSRLIADLDPDEWDLSPKPKWTRWRTYDRYVERYDAYEAILDYGIYELVAKLLSSHVSYCSMSSSARLMPKCAGIFAAGCAKFMTAQATPPYLSHTIRRRCLELADRVVVMNAGKVEISGQSP